MEGNDIGDRFRSIRHNESMSQKEFAQKLGTSQGVIADIERGAKDPSRAVLVALAVECHVNLNWLLLGIDSSNPPEKSAENNDTLKVENEALKKENSELADKVRKIEEGCKKLDDKNREISDELLERMRQLLEIQNPKLRPT
jgi:transcriptional regulator with XRE-family HTH domain